MIILSFQLKFIGMKLMELVKRNIKYKKSYNN
jgi:hypothetical protein